MLQNETLKIDKLESINRIIKNAGHNRNIKKEDQKTRFFVFLLYSVTQKIVQVNLKNVYSSGFDLHFIFDDKHKHQFYTITDKFFYFFQKKYSHNELSMVTNILLIGTKKQKFFSSTKNGSTSTVSVIIFFINFFKQHICQNYFDYFKGS